MRLKRGAFVDGFPGRPELINHTNSCSRFLIVHASYFPTTPANPPTFAPAAIPFARNQPCFISMA